ncbi:MAG: acetyltransferase [Bacteroidota bacterium]
MNATEKNRTKARSALVQKYFELAALLEEQNPGLTFRNHCYWRIALDNTVLTKWDTVMKRPAYQHLTTEQLAFAVRLLANYLDDKELLLRHNRVSLRFRR